MKPNELKPCRDAFEKWAKANSLDINPVIDEWTEKVDYSHSHINAMWRGWQAAYELAKPNGDGDKWNNDEYKAIYTKEIIAAHPTATGDHETYMEALELVNHRRSKYALVDMVNWLLVKNKSTPPQTKPANVEEALKLESVRKSLVLVNNAFGYEGEEYYTPPYPRWRRTIDSVDKSIATLDKMLEG